MRQSQFKTQHNLISHSDEKIYEIAVNELRQNVLKNTTKSDVPAIERMQILDELCSFELGRFLIQNRGLNGRWTQYLVLHPQNGRLTGLSSDGKPLSKFERWALDRCPIALAAQERFFTFQKLLQNKLKNGIRIASIPCGLMDDLLGLNYKNLNDFKLTGVDLDEQALQLALENAVQNRLEKHCEFIEEDAWNMQIKNQFDLITSNGLNIYEPDDERVEQFYSNLYKALKPEGTLISSFLTPPPTRENKSEWDASQINEDDLRIQRILLGDILNIRWLAAHRSESKMRDIFVAAGFKEVNVIYDRQKLFPTIVGNK